MCSTDLQVAAVDLIDYLQVTGQKMGKQVDRPALKSFGKDCVIGVGTGAHAHIPGLNINRGTNVKAALIPSTTLTVR